MNYDEILKGLVEPGEKHPLPALFAQEMLELNERLLAVELGADKRGLEKLRVKLAGMERRMEEGAAPLLARYVEGRSSAAERAELKDFYYKRKYLFGIQERLSTFASRDQD